MSTTENEEGLVKVSVDLPNHWAAGGESMWAEPRGSNRFRLKNVPFHAYGLNFDDTVKATPHGEDGMLTVRKVVEPSGHQTLRVIFHQHVPQDKRLELLQQLQSYDASFENADGTLWAIDIPPNGDYQGTFNQLEQWAKQELLGFETCHERVPDSFDDEPQAG